MEIFPVQANFFHTSLNRGPEGCVHVSARLRAHVAVHVAALSSPR